LNKFQDVGLEVLTALVTKVAISWDIMSCSPYRNQHFGGTYHLHLQGEKSAGLKTIMLAGSLIFDLQDACDTLLQKTGSYMD
jgi:hypothetical protein